MTPSVNRSKPPRQIILHCGDSTRIIPLDDGGRLVPQDEPLKCPMPQDKMVFAPTRQILNLFDPMPYTPALADDLSSFTQVFIYTLMQARDADDVMIHAEHVLLRNMLATDPVKLRAKRQSQLYDVRVAVGLLRRDRMFSAGRTPAAGDVTAWARAEARERFGDMVSTMQWLRTVLEVNEFQCFRNRWPGTCDPREGVPGKAAGEYAHYMAEFREMAEDYDEVQAKRRAAFEERREARARGERSEGAEDRHARGV